MMSHIQFFLLAITHPRTAGIMVFFENTEDVLQRHAMMTHVVQPSEANVLDVVLEWAANNPDFQKHQFAMEMERGLRDMSQWDFRPELFDYIDIRWHNVVLLRIRNANVNCGISVVAEESGVLKERNTSDTKMVAWDTWLAGVACGLVLGWGVLLAYATVDT